MGDFRLRASKARNLPQFQRLHSKTNLLNLPFSFSAAITVDHQPEVLCRFFSQTKASTKVSVASSISGLDIEQRRELTLTNLVRILASFINGGEGIGRLWRAADLAREKRYSRDPPSPRNKHRRQRIQLWISVMGMTPPHAHLGEDTTVWGLEANGRFTVKLTYLFLKDIEPSVQGSLWRKVWNWEGPAKIKQFMWLVSHCKLMTNDERQKRHIATDANCPDCNGACEDVDHVIRSCHVGKQVWLVMFPDFAQGVALLPDFYDWWIKGIGKGDSRLLFGVTAWLLSRRRNRLVFN
ncbi:Putative ribonuclease H protein At1g65750 [Linum perenne]